MAKKVAIFNQKGGVGKTTTAINLAAILGKMGKKVLLIDLDPQGNTTSGLGLDKRKQSFAYQVIIDSMPIKEGIIKSDFKNLDVLGSNNELAGLEVELARTDDWEHILLDKIKEVDEAYNYIFIDCPPSLGILSIVSLVAVDSVLIPVQCEYYALEGVSQLYETYKTIKRKLNRSIEIEGVLLSMYDIRTKLSSDVEKETRKFFGKKVFKHYIPRNVRLAEAPSHGLPIIYYDANSSGAKAYKAVGKEFIKRAEKRERG